MKKIDYVIPIADICIANEQENMLSGNMIRILFALSTLLVANTATLLSARPDTLESTGITEFIYDSLGTKNNKGSVFYFGIGAGICSGGASVGIDYTFLTKGNWGGHISYITNIKKAENIPSDWDEGGRTFYPKDYVNILSFNLRREFASLKKRRFGIEAGPSWVRKNRAEMAINPNYNANDDSDVNWLYKLGTSYKYDKSHSNISTIGLSLMGNVEFLSGKNLGLNISLYTNINSLASVVGLSFNMIFGRLITVE